MGYVSSQEGTLKSPSFPLKKRPVTWHDSSGATFLHPTKRRWPSLKSFFPKIGDILHILEHPGEGDDEIEMSQA